MMMSEYGYGHDDDNDDDDDDDDDDGDDDDQYNDLYDLMIKMIMIWWP